MKHLFSQGRFIASVFEEDQFPNMQTPHGKVLPEIALVGRSNVGKSSLINSLLQTRHLAKTSSTPGKTQSINFFSVDETLSLVDLPGYGYAKASGSSKKKWAHLIEMYLKKRKTLHLILFLLDSRREKTEQDISFLNWAAHYHIPVLLVFTKVDKLNRREKEELLKKNTGVSFVCYSIKESRARIDLIHHINTFFNTNGLTR